MLFPVVVLAPGCAESPPLEIPSPDVMVFQQTAYPVLLRDCGFPACHGDTRRFFRVFGPGRTRLVPTMASDAPVTADEIRESYTRAVSMLVVTDDDVAESLFLRKPLDKAVGGAGHEGEDSWGRNVYITVADPGFAALANWAYSVQPGSMEPAP